VALLDNFVKLIHYDCLYTRHWNRLVRYKYMAFIAFMR